MAKKPQYFGSTEPQARKVLEKITVKPKAKKKASKYKQGDTTAMSPEDIKKDNEQGLEELRKLREKQRKRNKDKK